MKITIIILVLIISIFNLIQKKKLKAEDSKKEFSQANNALAFTLLITDDGLNLAFLFFF